MVEEETEGEKLGEMDERKQGDGRKRKKKKEGRGRKKGRASEEGMRGEGREREGEKIANLF